VTQAPHALTQGTLLGGRLRYSQPEQGFRTGIEPLLLAAAVPARPGDRVLEAGTGAGAGMMALCARVPGLCGTALEIDPAIAALAAENFSANGFNSVAVERADLVAWSCDTPYDHAFANPPWHRTDGTNPNDAGRLRAKMAAPDLLGDWVLALASCLRRRGTLSLVLPAAQLCAAMVALEEAGCAETTLLPLWPRQDEPAKLIIVRGIRQGRGQSRVLPGLVLHKTGGSGYTAAADAVLRLGQALMM
jgi:tRNA1(Val) A37 N6-methylase TrmN6